MKILEITEKHMTYTVKFEPNWLERTFGIKN